MTHVRAVVVVVAVAASACGDAVRAPITIVVDTDRARAREEQGRLLELRAGVQGDRAELTSARVALQQARQRLEEAARGPQREALAAEVKVLEACVQARGDMVSGAELAEALAATEQRLLSAIAAAPRPSSSPSAPTGAGAASAPPAAVASASPTAGQAREILAEARRLVAAKGVALADLDGGAERLDRVEALMGRDDIATAIGVAETLRADAARVVVDRPLLQRRYGRLNARVVKAGLVGPAKAKAEGLLQAASTAISGGDVAAATAALSTLSADLGG
jgi:hypothetical protein